MDQKKLAIGVFDSGLGGISVLHELMKQMPEEDYLYFGDSAFAPYGVKTKEQITERCFYIVDRFIKQGVKAIVIACNTATSACVNELRFAYPDLIIIGMEPALKVAAQQCNGNRILVMATDYTLKEKKFKDLMKRYEKSHTIWKLPCPKLVDMIEHDTFHDEATVLHQLHQYLDTYLPDQIDSIVLGCTHFVFYKKQLKQLANHIQIIDGNVGTVRHLHELLLEQKLKKDTNEIGCYSINNSGEAVYKKYSENLLKSL